MPHWSLRLREALAQKGWTLAELGRRADVEYENLKKYYASKVDAPRGNILWRIASALGVTEQWLKFGVGPKLSQIPIIGYAGAGDEWIPADDREPNAADDFVDFTMGAADPIAIVVRGQSMNPVYRPGDVLMCARMAPTEQDNFLRRDSVVLTADDRCFIKIILPGDSPGYFRLRSYNTEFDDIPNAALTWAAPVVWIKRRGA